MQQDFGAERGEQLRNVGGRHVGLRVEPRPADPRLARAPHAEYLVPRTCRRAPEVAAHESAVACDEYSQVGYSSRAFVTSGAVGDSLKSPNKLLTESLMMR